jgi:nucleotide-binding universal stress UspA family protein
MIKEVMVRLDGSANDEKRLGAVEEIAGLFHAHVVGLYLNELPIVIAAEGDTIGAVRAVELIEKAKELGEKREKTLMRRLARLQMPVELRRYDVFPDTLPEIATREARVADTFVALRPNGEALEPEYMIENVLFGGGRHLYLLPEHKRKIAFDNIVVAWNGAKEATRAMAEALPYLEKAENVTVLVVDDEPPAEGRVAIGEKAVTYLKHHGINAVLRHAAVARSADVGPTLISEAKKLDADLIVMGGYGHSRLREWLLGGATYALLHNAPIPVLMAH